MNPLIQLKATPRLLTALALLGFSLSPKAEAVGQPTESEKNPEHQPGKHRRWNATWLTLWLRVPRGERGENFLEARFTPERIPHFIELEAAVARTGEAGCTWHL